MVTTYSRRTPRASRPPGKKNSFLDGFSSAREDEKLYEQKQRGASRTRKGFVDSSDTLLDRYRQRRRRLATNRANAIRECREIDVIRIDLAPALTVSLFNRRIRLRFCVCGSTRDFVASEGSARSQQGRRLRSTRNTRGSVRRVNF